MGMFKEIIKKIIPPSRAQAYEWLDEMRNNINEIKHSINEIDRGIPMRQQVEGFESFEPVGNTIALEEQMKIPCLETAQEYKIQNLLFPDCDWKFVHNRMFYWGDSLKFTGKDKWKINGKIDFFSYFNALTVKKWKQYTGIENYQLHLKLKGKFYLQFYGRFMTHKDDGSLDAAIDIIYKSELGTQSKRNLIIDEINFAKTNIENFDTYYFDTRDFENSDGVAEIIFPIQYEKADVVGFYMQSADEEGGEIYEGYYAAAVVPGNLNTVDISICTTTFKKEDFITANLELIKKDILDKSSNARGCDELAYHLFVNVVDNGQTLNHQKLSSDKIEIYPNPNTGGAGGFSRGMIETSELKKSGRFNATHIIFMDDDIEILPESLKRTYALLTLLKPEYQDYFISGAMLFLERRNEQHEDVSIMSDEFVHTSLKPPMFLHLQHDVLKNEQKYIGDNQYAPWWYCVTPIKFAGADNLSIPLFYRGDDIEFGNRNKARIITLNGICVWHLGFAVKENPVIDLYLIERNYFITQAIGSLPQNIDLLKNLESQYTKGIRSFAYENCELLLDALEDFMNGPAFFAESDSYKILAEHMKKRETLRPFTGLDYNRVFEYITLEPYKMRLFEDTDNGHLLPDNLLIDQVSPPAIAHIFFESPGKQFLQRRLIAVNVHNKTARIREMNKEKYKQLQERKEMLFARYNENKEELYAEYREYFAKFKTEEFWREYLKIGDRNT